MPVDAALPEVLRSGERRTGVVLGVHEDGLAVGVVLRAAPQNGRLSQHVPEHPVNALSALEAQEIRRHQQAVRDTNGAAQVGARLPSIVEEGAPEELVVSIGRAWQHELHLSARLGGVRPVAHAALDRAAHAAEALRLIAAPNGALRVGRSVGRAGARAWGQRARETCEAPESDTRARAP